MEDIIKTKSYEYSYASLKKMMHEWYLKADGGKDTSVMMVDFFQKKTLEEVVKHYHCIFKLYVKEYGNNFGVKFEEWIDKLNCVANNHIVRVLSQNKDITESELSRYLYNLRPGRDFQVWW